MEDKIKCDNCHTVYSATMNYCPKCGVHKWYRKPASQPSRHISADNNHNSRNNKASFEKPAHPHPEIDPVQDLPKLADIDDVEKILTDEFHIRDAGRKNLKIMRYIIIILLLILNLAAINALVSRRTKAGAVNNYNQVIRNINDGELQKAGEIVIGLEESMEKDFLLGLIYFKAEKYGRAKEYLLKTRNSPVYSSYSDAMISYIFYTEGKFTESYDCIKRAVRSLPDLPNLRENYNNIKLHIVKDQ